MTAAFPPFSLWPLSAIALVPLFGAVHNEEWRRAWRRGWIFGLVYFGSLLWWLAPTIARFGNMSPWVAWPVIGLLVCYLAVYPAIWAGLAAFLLCRGGNRMLYGMLLALCWGSLEWLRGWIISGFPWGTISYALAPQPLLIQSAEIWGPYFMSTLLVFLNFLFWNAIISLNVHYRITGAMASMLLASALCGTLALFGVMRCEDIRKNDTGYPEVRTAAVQGALAQELKWEPGLQLHTAKLYRELTLKAVERTGMADSGPFSKDLLIVWPETAMPFFYQSGREPGGIVRNTARDIHGAILFGSPAFRSKAHGRRDYFNRAYLVDSRGNVAGTYDKVHLVPFGEYLPLGPLAPWARKLVPTAGDFVPGSSVAPLHWNAVSIGVLICFESIFPELSRRSVGFGANCLAVITNDSWFGDTGAPWQHADMAAFRAVETRRWVIRAANTGISEIIAPTGRVVAKSSLFRQDIITATVRLRDDITLYQRMGDMPLLLCTIAGLVFAFMQSRMGRIQWVCRNGSLQ